MADIIIDDTSSRVTAGGGTWKRVTTIRYFDGGTIYPDFACNAATGDTGEYGTLSVTFQGTSIAFRGNTPSAACSQTISVSIDGSAPYNTSYEDPSPQTARQWYQSPLLQDAQHTINIAHIAGTSVDVMVVKAGPTTPLSGERLIVDDDDTTIKYTGGWSRVGGPFTTTSMPSSGMPYGNATHQSNTVGSTATFQFSGTSVAVYSVWDYSRIGAVDVIYKIDSDEFPRTYSVTTDTPRFKDGIHQKENVLLFSSEPLPAGVHTLTIKVTSSTNNTAMVLDYILYHPSFETLATMPKLPGISTTPTLLPYTSTEPGPTTSITVPSTGSHTVRPVPIGAIVGGVLGGIATLTLFFIFLRKRRFRRFRLPPIVHAAPRTEVEPFTATDPNTRIKYGFPGKLGAVTASTARIGQLQDLVAQLERAISESGEDSLRVAELKRQVAHLMTQDTRHPTVDVPPPYQFS